MKNPFIYGKIVTDENFCNRKEEINELIRAIRNGQNVILFSPRRYGKTSLIKEVLKRVKKNGILTYYIDLYPAITKHKFIEIYANGIASNIPGKIEKIIATLKKIIPLLIPKIIVKPEGQAEFEFSYDKSAESIPAILDDLFMSVEKIADRKKKNAVVVFDEFQEITNYGDEEIERKMRSIFQMHQNVSYIFMGSKRHLMDEIFNRRDRAFYKSGKHLVLNKINPAELTTFIKEKFNNTNFNISDEAIFTIVEKASAHPYYTQFLCSELWNLNLDTKQITTETIDIAVKNLLSKESSAYINIWESLSIRQKQVLNSLAKFGGSNIFKKEFLAYSSIPSISTLQRAVKKIYTDGILNKTNGTYIIEDVFFEHWILDNF
ncbi:MAG: ATP-binding protein [Candidatus Cloacimonetes bacterium]|nr:ATP-binding protein [Candidatus Cloacimonadota bacterium]